MINMIMAISKNGVIGVNNILPWRIVEDLRTFKKLTMGGVVVVGQNTSRSLPILNGREVVVLKRGELSLLDVKKSYIDRDVWIAGGAKVYREAMDLDICDKAYITMIEKEYDGDTYFAVNEFIDNPKWKLVSTEILRQDEPLVRLLVFEKEELK